MKNEDIAKANQQNQPIIGEYDADCAVRTRTGIYVGKKDTKTVCYLGIPYAKPPVGELRWKAPEPLPSSEAVFEAKHYGASAIQVEHRNSLLNHHRQSEDCLTLNVVTGVKKTKELKPVLVLFHHGDFSYGGSVDPLLDGGKFVGAHSDVVFVSFNFRLGLFGFIDFTDVPGGEVYPDALNLGLLDQIAALQWIRENIASFGGDPERITALGFEAGATSICLLAASEKAKGLFQKAFLFDGSPVLAYDDSRYSRALAVNLLKETHTMTMDELLRLDTESLNEASQRLWQGGNMYSPSCDGALIPADVYCACRDGAASGIDFIIGFPSKEMQVLVWIHGGAFEVGGTVEPREEGSNFVKENPDAILVSIDYSLGVFGFLHLSHLPDGKDYPDAQNLGLLDQVMALKWVHENIAAFGGAPDNVTIMGQSAGGGSVSLLPLIKGSQKYFHRVIAQSGSPVFTRSTEQAISCTNELMSKLGCKTVADLQKLDVKKFVNEADILTLRVWAERDGRTLPLDPYEAYANGAAKDIDFLQGCTKDEMGYFIYGFGLEGYNEFVADRMTKKLAQLTDKEKALVESYCKDAKNVSPEYSATSRLFDQIVFIAPLFRMSENQTKAGGKSYTYYFMPESSWPLLRSGHAIELSTVFKHPEERLVTGRRFDETFSKTLRKMWVQFAKTGNPSLSAEISPDGKDHEWPLYDVENKQIMIFDEFNIHPEKESERKILDWERTYFLTKYYCI